MSERICCVHVHVHVLQVYHDCDRDSLIYLGDPIGPTCHTGARYVTLLADPVDMKLSDSRMCAVGHTLMPFGFGG
jgi:hypothetical protein